MTDTLPIIDLQQGDDSVAGTIDETALREQLLPFRLAAEQRAESRFGAEGDGPSIYFSDPDSNVVELEGPGRPV